MLPSMDEHPAVLLAPPINTQPLTPSTNLTRIARTRRRATVSAIRTKIHAAISEGVPTPALPSVLETRVDIASFLARCLACLGRHDAGPAGHGLASGERAAFAQHVVCEATELGPLGHACGCG